jgi:hypothetical protein
VPLKTPCIRRGRRRGQTHSAFHAVGVPVRCNPLTLAEPVDNFSPRWGWRLRRSASHDICSEGASGKGPISPGNPFPVGFWNVWTGQGACIRAGSCHCHGISVCRDHQCIYYLFASRFVVVSFQDEPGFRTWCCAAGVGWSIVGRGAGFRRTWSRYLNPSRRNSSLRCTHSPLPGAGMSA